MLVSSYIIMSIQSNFKSAQTIINRVRIGLHLRILWPDFQIYDLISSDLTFSQIQHFSSFPPLILPIDITQEQLPFPLKSKEYTHIAIAKRREIKEDLEVLEVMYAFLTKRNMAIDQISLKYLHGKYRLDVQVAQLDRKSYFWGAEVITNEVKIVNPKYIRKRNTTWQMEYEFESSIKGFIFYSVERYPVYEKSYYGSYLPKDVKREACLKYRTFESILDSYFQMPAEEPLQTSQNHHSYISLRNIFLGKEKKEVREENRSAAKNLFKESSQFQQIDSNSMSRSKGIHIQKIKENTVTNLYQKDEIGRRLSESVKQLQQISQKYADINILFDAVSEGDGGRDRQQIKLVSDIMIFNRQNPEFKLEVLQKAIRLEQSNIVSYLILNLILQFHRSEQQTLSQWIKYMELIGKMTHKSVQRSCHAFLINVLIMNSKVLLKDADNFISRLELLMGRECLKECVQEILCLHRQNQEIISDMLFFLMKVEGEKTIFSLYLKSLLLRNSAALCQSIDGWLLVHRFPSSKVMSLKYITNQEINMKISDYTSDKKECSFKDLLGLKKGWSEVISFSTDNFSKNSLIVTREFKVYQDVFKMFVLRKDNFIYCLFERIILKRQAIRKNSIFSSYDIGIEMKVNQKCFENSFGWNFSFPSHSAGCRFRDDQQQSFPLTLFIYMKPSIIHSSLLTFMAIRYPEELKFPAQIAVQEDSNSRANQKLLKRRSTFLLEHDGKEKEGKMRIECFFHEKCGLCAPLLDELTVYILEPLDMFSLLLSAPFQRESNCLLALLKYLSLNKVAFQNVQFMVAALRLCLMSVEELIGFIHMEGVSERVHKFMGKMIQEKIQLIAGGKSSKLAVKYLFKEKARDIGQQIRYIEGDYSKAYCEYLLSTKI